jgi:hypothetical protein
MSEATYENLVHDLYESEEKLSEENRIEYYRRKRFLEAALEQYVQNCLHGDECNEDRAKLLLKRESLTYKFIFMALMVVIISWIVELEIELCLLLTTLLLGYFGKTYMDIKIDDLGYVNEYVLHEFDNQKIDRDLAAIGISLGTMREYKNESYVKSGKHVGLPNVDYDLQDLLSEIYMKQRLVEKLYKE